MDFTHLFQSYWWLIFPIAFFIGAGWDSWMKLQRHKATLDLLKSYAASGKEPPADLMRALERSSKSEMAELSESGWDDGDSKSGGGGNAFLVLLFLGLGGVFFYAGRTGMLDLGEEAYLVAMIMGVLAIAFLGAAIFKRR